MKAIEIFAEFDKNRKLIIEDSPLLKNKKVKLLILIEDDNDLYNLAVQGLSKAYSDDEPEYDLSVVNEPNESYLAE